MHLHQFGYLVQDQGLHGLGTVFEEVALMLHDPGGHFHQCFIAAVQALEEPACLLQVIPQIGVVGAAVGPFDEAGIIAVDTQFWRDIGVELHHPAAVFLADKHVGYHILGTVLTHRLARVGVEGLDQRQHLLEFRLLEAGAAHDLGKVAIAQLVDMARENELGLLQPGGGGRQLLQLHQQAFLQVPGADAGGFELLQPVQDGHHLVHFDVHFQILGKGQANLLQVLYHPPVVIRRVDDGQGDHAVYIGKPGEVQLPQQLFPQGVIGGIAAFKTRVGEIVAGKR